MVNECILTNCSVQTILIVERFMPGDQLSPPREVGEWWKLSTPTFNGVGDARAWITNENKQTQREIKRVFKHRILMCTTTTATIEVINDDDSSLA